MVRRLLKQSHGGQGPFLDRLLGQFRLVFQSGHHGVQILQGQEIHRCVEKGLAASIVVMGQKFL